MAVVGRDEELGALYAFLDTATHGPTALALEGEAGIGKSTLWRAALDAARERGLRTLSARPAESERELAYAGLGDLFEGALEDVLPGLTPPQRRALEVALLLEDAAGRPVDARALGVAVRSALQSLAEDGLVVGIDDLQWLDTPSARALGFALRRLPEANLRLIWTRRVGGGEPSPIEDVLDPDRIDRLRVGPLSLGAVNRILPRAVPRPTLLRLHEASGGNPFYALELARALGDNRDPTEPLPVPERLEELVSARLNGFAPATRDALVLASADARLTPAQLAKAGLADALEPALAANIVELRDGTVRFTHPLLASVLYQGLSATERHRAHAQLADLSEDTIGRARHLALSADRTDAELAGVLEQAANAAAAPSAAAELAEHALRLTPPERREDVDRVAAFAARAHYLAGEVERAQVLTSDLLARAPAGLARAKALVLIAEFNTQDHRLRVQQLTEALAEDGLPPALRASIHQRLSLTVRFTAGLERAEQHGRAAVEIAEQLGDTALRGAALASVALCRFNAGKAGALQLAEEAYALARPAPSWEQVLDAGFSLAHVLVWSMDLERARVLLEELYREASERDERRVGYAHWYLAHVELRAGRFAKANEHAEQTRALGMLYGRDEAQSPTSVVPLALVAAHRGDLDLARRLAKEACRLVGVHNARLSVPPAVLAIIDLWQGDAETAVAGFATAEQSPNAADRFEPCMCWWRAEQVEALLELGRIDDAVARLDAWEADARRLDRAWALAHATRCRGLVAAARGDVEHALPLLEEAAGRHADAGDPFGRARALLALGTTRRRARQKRPAREALEAAHRGFEELGAARWAKRASDELAGIGGRTRIDGLTPAERRVADLVAQGRTNAEVAAALFLAERTVASHLTHVYSKLGVRSRTELARRLD